MELFILWLALAIGASYFSKTRGNGFWGVFVISIILSPLVGFIVALVSKPNLRAQEYQAIAAGDHKKCPACAELIKVDANVCRYCQHKFVAAAIMMLLVLFGATGCERAAQAVGAHPPIKQGDKFCLDSGGFGSTKFYETVSVSYPWIEAKPNADCAKNVGANMTFWINLSAVPAFSPDCVCKPSAGPPSE